MSERTEKEMQDRLMELSAEISQILHEDNPSSTDEWRLTSQLSLGYSGHLLYHRGASTEVIILGVAGLLSNVSASIRTGADDANERYYRECLTRLLQRDDLESTMPIQNIFHQPRKDAS